ncbi:MULTISPECIES: ATP-binding protein [unclassified Nitrobacter]|uniref:ATP-binding protein n=1 Tax=unclassified Nitrobacter TaxID=2620411 RepID=UPI002110014C|nr:MULTISPECIES: ATP-binding protein [unclassified Nitrobacter]
MPWHVSTAASRASSTNSPACNCWCSTTGGTHTLNDQQRLDLLEIFEERYRRKSTLITAQLPVAQWHDMIGEPTIADAILDRIIHNAHRITLEGESMRKKKAAHPLTKSENTETNTD